jgi:hypothetical protein
MSCFAGNSVDFSTCPEKIPGFFDDMNNFRFIMPDQVENWQSDENNCSFSIKNLGNLGMKKGTFELPDHFTFVSNEVSKVNFVLQFQLKNSENNEKQGCFEICADMNPMIEMMAKRPLTNFVNILTTNFQRYLDGS